MAFMGESREIKSSEGLRWCVGEFVDVEWKGRRVESIKRPPCGAWTAGSVMFGSCMRSGDDLAVAMVGHRRHGLCSSLYEPVNKGLTTNGRKKHIVEGSKERLDVLFGGE